MSEIERVLDPSDPFCPKCGHNRSTSSVSSIDVGGGRKSCQMCGTEWSEDTAEQVRQAVLAERERCARVCDEQAEELIPGYPNLDDDRYMGAEQCAAAIRRG